LLKFKLLDGDVVEIKDISHSFTITRKQFWYYDVENWMVSSNGRKDDVPDRPMNEMSKNYFKKFHMKKVDELRAYRQLEM